ncbi:uncharacterized protein LOC129793004 [Lutzomyia longipalpis]|uniref:Chitin-binding type-2 domain-containing protein n=2 Tax=Lutzomyia longipalpis TaxID=7200 RepID=A0A1B0CDP8_LUTLO|nr:uncharacterized protein LOC129793004 [Lutzomyia longipalpis]XP_055688511.1 uncharacterized protein LOC129793004 [Lutzomyia longipalpis]
MKLINFMGFCACLCILPATIFGQTFKGTPINHGPVGAHRVIPRTDFSCRGRPAGYYADIETGCEIYHMCDGLGRQFSYACPNTTLFQQRMLICDHWYMVNCSRAESNYAANLLIGQRDKPFVGEEEHELRTPRPDLLDRPYSPDYSGESFRRHFKTTPAIQNTISGRDSQPKASSGKTIESDGFLETANSNYQGPQILPIHWSTKNGNAAEATPSVRRDVKNEEFVPANRRVDEVAEVPADDGKAEIIVLPSPTGFSVPAKTVKAPPATPTPVKNASVKKPSLLYEPPFLLPDYNRNVRTQATVKATTPPNTPQIQNTGKPFTASGVKDPIVDKVSKVRNAPRTEPPVTATARVLSDNPFIANSLQTAKPTVVLQQTNKPATPAPSIVSQNPFIAKAVQTAKPTVGTQQLNSRPSPTLPLPSRELLPPRPDVRKHDDATTEGPPIYYEWKWAVPAYVLEPPKPLNDTAATAASRKQQGTAAPIPDKFAHNPFLSRAFQGKGGPSSSERSPTPRAFSAANNKGSTDKPKQQEPANDYNELKKTLLIPDFEFPLEKDVRPGFDQKEARNSFQLVIPTKSDKPWYGENPKCPDCHPAYLQPGTCEPCIRIR